MIEVDIVITNGYVDSDTILHMLNKGWNFVATVPATLVHPYAAWTDKATIFTKYHEPTPTSESCSCEANI